MRTRARLKVTPYRLINTISGLAFGIPKAVANSKGETLLAQRLDWAAGLLIALILIWIGYIESDDPTSFWWWMFNKDLSSYISRSCRALLPTSSDRPREAISSYIHPIPLDSRSSFRAVGSPRSPSPHDLDGGGGDAMTDVQVATTSATDIGEDTPLRQRVIPRKSAPNLTGSINDIDGPHFVGSYSDIYYGHWTTPRGSERVALKLLRVFENHNGREAMKRFRRDVENWRLLHHPHILPFYGTCARDEISLFLVSPLADGGGSLEYLRRHPTANRGMLLYQTSSALEYLHSGKDVPPIIHGNLKAENVLISQAGDALLCDFGLSRDVGEWVSLPGSPTVSERGLRSMAPELFLGVNTKQTEQSDVYAFGSLMLQIYTEKVPFSDLSEPQAVLALVNGQVPTRPTDLEVLARGLDDRVWALINDCWKSEPSHRPSMADVLWRLLWAVAR